jgi:DNA-binding GntR family transcriptional regulator
MTDTDTLVKQAYVALRQKLILGQLPPGSRHVNRAASASLARSNEKGER